MSKHDNSKKTMRRNAEKSGATDTAYAGPAGNDTEPRSNTEDLSQRINEALKEAFATGDPASELAGRVCELHKQWLCTFWKAGTYTKAAHKALAESYVADESFKAYYDAIAPGCAEFLRDAISIYCKE